MALYPSPAAAGEIPRAGVWLGGEAAVAALNRGWVRAGWGVDASRGASRPNAETPRPMPFTFPHKPTLFPKRLRRSNPPFHEKPIV